MIILMLCTRIAFDLSATAITAKLMQALSVFGKTTHLAILEVLFEVP